MTYCCAPPALGRKKTRGKREACGRSEQKRSSGGHVGEDDIEAENWLKRERKMTTIEAVSEMSAVRRAVWFSAVLFAATPLAYAQVTWTPIYVGGYSEYNCYSLLVTILVTLYRCEWSGNNETERKPGRILKCTMKLIFSSCFSSFKYIHIHGALRHPLKRYLCDVIGFVLSSTSGNGIYRFLNSKFSPLEPNLSALKCFTPV